MQELLVTISCSNKNSRIMITDNRRIHLILHLIINSLLHRNNELRNIAKRTKSVMIGISESKTDFKTDSKPESSLDSQEGWIED